MIRDPSNSTPVYSRKGPAAGLAAGHGRLTCVPKPQKGRGSIRGNKHSYPPWWRVSRYHRLKENKTGRWLEGDNLA